MHKLIDNTNLNIFLRQRSNESVEACANVSGTEKILSESYQTEEKQELFTSRKAATGLGNVFLKREYHVDPEVFRTLQTGEAYCVSSEPEFRSLVMLNYVPPLPWEGEFRKIEVDLPARYTRVPLFSEAKAIRIRPSV